MDNLLISALSAVDVRDLSYAEWMNVGMALKHEGYACSVWDSGAATISAIIPVSVPASGIPFMAAVHR